MLLHIMLPPSYFHQSPHNSLVADQHSNTLQHPPPIHTQPTLVPFLLSLTTSNSMLQETQQPCMIHSTA
jgi:hypothetical protein